MVVDGEISEESLIDQLKGMTRSERVDALFDFEPTDYQTELLDYAEEEDKAEAAVKPGRQVGKTLTGAAIAADAPLVYADEDILLAAPFQETADEMFRETKRFYKNAPVSKEHLGVIEDNKRTWEFANGSRILSRTLGDVTSSRPGQRGKNPVVVIIDEAAYAKDRVYKEVIEEFFITHDSYEYYLFSTPKGKSGYFYEKVEQDSNWFSPHWPTEISPFAQQDFIDRKRRELDRKTFAQEFLGEFVDTGEKLIPTDLYLECKATDLNLLEERYLGVDIARKGRDRTVYIEMDVDGAVNVIDSEEQSTVPSIIGRIKDLHSEHTYQAILIDENAVGGGVADDTGLNEIRSFHPVSFSTKSKHEMYTNLVQSFENGSITVPNHRRLQDETTSLDFDYTQNGYLKVEHPDRGHDDHPDSLALANHGRVGEIDNKATPTFAW